MGAGVAEDKPLQNQFLLNAAESNLLDKFKQINVVQK